MKTQAATTLLMLLAGLCLAQTSPQRKESYLVVKITGRDGSESYAVMTPAEYKAAEAEIRGEARYSMKAMFLAQKAWADDETNRRKSFPRSAIGKRKVRVSGRPFKSRSAAEEEAADNESKIIEKKQRDVERQEEKERLIRENRNRSGGRHQPTRSAAKTRADQEKEARREAERAGFEDRARALFEAKLAEVKQARQGGDR